MFPTKVVMTWCRGNFSLTLSWLVFLTRTWRFSFLEGIFSTSGEVNGRTNRMCVPNPPRPRISEPKFSRIACPLCSSFIMVHYSSAISYYQSTLPLAHRTIRSSSVERSSHFGSSMDSANSRFMRASTIGPSSIFSGNSDLYGVMPFNRSLHAIEDRIRTRAASLEPVNTYRRAYHTSTPYGASTTFDYKVLCDRVVFVQHCI